MKAMGLAAAQEELLMFPGTLAPRYPVCGYPRVAEFRRMLEELDLERDLCQWQGHYFYAHTAILDNVFH